MNHFIYFLGKVALALLFGGSVWIIADYFGGEPRALDFYIFSSIELVAITMTAKKLGYEE